MAGWNSIYVLTAAECDAAAGELIDTTGWTEANKLNWCLQAESIINVTCRRVFASTIAAFAALPASTRYILTATVCDWVAMMGIKHNMAGFTSRVEAEDYVNILRDDFLRNLSILRDTKTQDFLVKGTL